MAYRILFRHRKFLVILFLSILMTILLIYYNLDDQNKNVMDDRNEHLTKRLAILVPFRDRFDELMVFVPKITNFLRFQKIDNFTIVILNQSAKYRFNRGYLINVGFMLTKNFSDYIAIHDVDLIPLNVNLSYAYPKYGPYHMASPHYHPLYNYPKYFGGIVLISNSHFEQANGFSNRYYGWGIEDDEFFTRIRSLGLPVFRPNSLSTNTTNTFLHMHYRNRKRDNGRTKLQQEVLTKRDNETGLSGLEYTVLGNRHKLIIDDNSECQVFNIELICDRKKTPWCLQQKTEHN